MVEVVLHGSLAKEFGKTWHFDISTPREAFDAIAANAAGFRERIKSLASQGYVFHVRGGDHDYADDDAGMTLGNVKRLDIAPMVMGSSAAARFITGAILLVASVLFPPAAPFLQPIGSSLIIGSLVEWLTPVAKRQEPGKTLQSWSINGPNNDLTPGQVVPVIYGEVLTGGYPISGGLSASDLSAEGSVEPDVVIGGQFNVAASYPGAPTIRVVLQFNAGPFNLREPFTYTWTTSGFVGATVTRYNETSANFRIEVSVPLADAESKTVVGTVGLLMSGRDASTSAGERVNVSDSQTVEVIVDNKPYAWEHPGGA